MEGRSLLFTQLAPWKGLLNMKYEESKEVGGRELGGKEGREPSGWVGECGVGVTGPCREGVKGYALDWGDIGREQNRYRERKVFGEEVAQTPKEAIQLEGESNVATLNLGGEEERTQ